MTLTIDLTPQAEAWLSAEARQNGVLPSDWAQRVLEERAALSAPISLPPAIDAENAAALALLNQWIAEDATDDPEEIRKVDKEVAELKRNLNANRAETGERLVFL